MDAGDLVPDELIMRKRLQEDDCKQGYLLDGFPRTIPQAEQLKALLADMGGQLDAVANLNVPREVILDCLTTRRTCACACASCGAIYNVKSAPAKVESVCDLCGGKVVQRDDETEEAISNRLDVYNEKTAPLADFYRNEGMLMDVEAIKVKVGLAA